jgi:magnesium chelatase family protein
MSSDGGESSAAISSRVKDARDRQQARLAGTPWTCNAQVTGGFARRRANLSDEATAVLAQAVERMALSGRGFDRAIRVARTIADLEGSGSVERAHMSEALGYRALSSGDGAAAAG